MEKKESDSSRCFCGLENEWEEPRMEPAFIRVSDERLSFKKVLVTSSEKKAIEKNNAEISKDHKKTSRAKAKTVSLRDSDQEQGSDPDAVEEQIATDKRAQYLTGAAGYFIYKKTVGREQDIGIQIFLHGMKVSEYAESRGMKPATVSSTLSKLKKKIRAYVEAQDEKKKRPKRKDQRNLIIT